MKVAPAVEAEVLGVVDDAAGSTDVTAPRSAEMEPGREMAPVTVQPGAGGARGSVEYLGLWKEEEYRCFSLCCCLCPSCDKRAMPVQMKGEGEGVTVPTRVAFGKFVDELVQNKAPGGILAIREWTEAQQRSENHWVYVTLWRVSWSASPDDTSYQRHGFVGMESDQSENIRFVDFEGVVDDLGGATQIAVYRVTLPRGGLDADKWAGRPPPPAPEDLHTGPRRDGLLSMDEISGDYRRCCFPFCCDWMTVAPLGPDAIETWSSGCFFFPPLIGPTAEGAARTRDLGTNAFGDMTFSADGTASGGFKKRPGSQKRAFQKVDARDLAGNWRGCFCIPFVPIWPFSMVVCTTKKALNQDQYEESGLCCWLCLPLPYLCGGTRTRVYVNGHATNGFANGEDIHWHRDPGCAAGADGNFFAKRLC